MSETRLPTKVIKKAIQYIATITLLVTIGLAILTGGRFPILAGILIGLCPGAMIGAGIAFLIVFALLGSDPKGFIEKFTRG